MSSTEAMRLFVKILEVIQILLLSALLLCDADCQLISFFISIFFRKKILVGIRGHLTLL